MSRYSLALRNVKKHATLRKQDTSRQQALDDWANANFWSMSHEARQAIFREALEGTNATTSYMTAFRNIIEREAKAAIFD